MQKRGNALPRFSATRESEELPRVHHGTGDSGLAMHFDLDRQAPYRQLNRTLNFVANSAICAGSSRCLLVSVAGSNPWLSRKLMLMIALIAKFTF
jgi:hypothetical protein